jgi:hypothetical protein
MVASEAAARQLQEQLDDALATGGEAGDLLKEAESQRDEVGHAHRRDEVGHAHRRNEVGHAHRRNEVGHAHRRGEVDIGAWGPCGWL